MKNKIIYLLVVMFSISLITSANQCTNWPGSIYLTKSVRSIKKSEKKKDRVPEFEISPGSWLL